MATNGYCSGYLEKHDNRQRDVYLLSVCVDRQYTSLGLFAYMLGQGSTASLWKEQCGVAAKDTFSLPAKLCVLEQLLLVASSLSLLPLGTLETKTTQSETLDYPENFFH